MRSYVHGFFVLVFIVRCTCVTPGNGYRNGFPNGQELDFEELARQNRITQQILEHFLEKRLFPAVRPPSRVPTVWEILPKVNKHRGNNIQEVLLKGTDAETLQSVESEQVQSVYDDVGSEEGCLEKVSQPKNERRIIYCDYNTCEKWLHTDV